MNSWRSPSPPFRLILHYFALHASSIICKGLRDSRNIVDQYYIVFITISFQAEWGSATKPAMVCWHSNSKTEKIRVSGPWRETLPPDFHFFRFPHEGENSCNRMTKKTGSCTVIASQSTFFPIIHSNSVGGDGNCVAEKNWWLWGEARLEPVAFNVDQQGLVRV